MVTGQQHGGIAQGAAQALYEGYSTMKKEILSQEI